MPHRQPLAERGAAATRPSGVPLPHVFAESDDGSRFVRALTDEGLTTVITVAGPEGTKCITREWNSPQEVTESLPVILHQTLVQSWEKVPGATSRSGRGTTGRVKPSVATSRWPRPTAVLAHLVARVPKAMPRRREGRWSASGGPTSAPPPS